jgi:hypothetical protein
VPMHGTRAATRGASIIEIGSATTGAVNVRA